ncbi:phage holin family protein [Rhodobacteraceae bacterium]|nr:phage holin family protein [Paracoccaceae bacterium]
MHNDDTRHVPGQMTQAFRHFANLLQGEMKLARAEMSQNLSQAGLGLAFFGIAAILALVALNVLAGAVVAFIAANGVSAGWAAVIVGGTLLLIAAVLSLRGKARLSAEALKPTRTMAAMERDIENIKEATSV